MNKNLRNILITLACLVLAGLVAWYIYRDLGVKPDLLGKPEIAETIGAPGKFTPEQAAVIRANFNIARENIRADENNPLNWLYLGILYKTVGDYDKTSEAWEYVTRRWPDDAPAYANLADLYAFYIKDQAKADQYFRLALEKQVNNLHLYRNAYTFYRYEMKDDKHAKEILQEGVNLNPDNSADLQYILDHYDEV